MCCRAAVERAFDEMRAGGVPDRHAFEAALFIHRFHHPDVPLPDAYTEVFRWTLGRVLH